MDLFIKVVLPHLNSYNLIIFFHRLDQYISTCLSVALQLYKILWEKFINYKNLGVYNFTFHFKVEELKESKEMKMRHIFLWVNEYKFKGHVTMDIYIYWELWYRALPLYWLANSHALNVFHIYMCIFWVILAYPILHVFTSSPDTILIFVRNPLLVTVGASSLPSNVGDGILHSMTHGFHFFRICYCGHGW